MTCATCAKWLPKKTDPAMARLRLAICEHGPRWVFLPPHATCPKHREADAQTVAAREKWLAAGARSA